MKSTGSSTVPCSRLTSNGAAFGVASLCGVTTFSLVSVGLSKFHTPTEQRPKAHHPGSVNDPCERRVFQRLEICRRSSIRRFPAVRKIRKVDHCQWHDPIQGKRAHANSRYHVLNPPIAYPRIPRSSFRTRSNTLQR